MRMCMCMCTCVCVCVHVCVLGGKVTGQAQTDLGRHAPHLLTLGDMPRLRQPQPCQIASERS
jgi:hypothetical protein